MSKGQLFDVVAVDIKTRKVRMIAKGKSEKNADAIVRMAVMRRGVDTEFLGTIYVTYQLDHTKVRHRSVVVNATLRVSRGRIRVEDIPDRYC